MTAPLLRGLVQFLPSPPARFCLLLFGGSHPLPWPCFVLLVWLAGLACAACFPRRLVRPFAFRTKIQSPCNLSRRQGVKGLPQVNMYIYIYKLLNGFFQKSFLFGLPSVLGKCSVDLLLTCPSRGLPTLVSQTLFVSR